MGLVYGCEFHHKYLIPNLVKKFNAIKLVSNANRACRIGPNFPACWFPCFIHYHIFTLSLSLNYEMA